MPGPPTTRSRREFLAAAAALATVSLVPGMVGRMFPHTRQQETDEDREIAERILARAQAQRLGALPLGTLVGTVGRGFIRSPYRGGTLEAPGEEHLIVNLRQFDCVTFVESSLALARAIRQGVTDAEGFRRELQTLRYRDGIIRGYPSRLHYFTDWIADNAARKNVTDLSQELGGILDTRVIHFMTAHRNAYPHLTSDDDYAAVAETERLLTGRLRYMIPRAQVKAVLPALRDGDIIGVTTAMEGLDCSHTGLVAREGRTAKFLHAPLSGGRVQISRGSLAEYIAGREGHAGIVVARPMDPVR